METFSALLAICEWNSLVAGEFPSSAPEQMFKYTIETLVIWDTIALIMSSL